MLQVEVRVLLLVEVLVMVVLQVDVLLVATPGKTSCHPNPSRLLPLCLCLF